MQAILALEDGTNAIGDAFGATGEQWGEVVFNTGMTGYEEVLTDPSYCGQIVMMTYPLIGNYGINNEGLEARNSFVRGFVVHERCYSPSNWRLTGRISEFLARENVIGLSGVDTRALTRRLRSYGTMRGVISTETLDPKTLVERACQSPHLSGQKLVPEVATQKVFTVTGDGPRVVLIDYGAKLNVIRCLQKRGCEIVVVPPALSAKAILELNPVGIVLSNGPGDPVDVPYAIDTIRKLVGEKPIFGICLGHQILGLSLGGRTYKLKFGHRGANHPVKDIATGRVYITSQNHGYAVDEKSLHDKDIYVSHRNLNDNTVEGLAHRFLPVMSVQYHPEASPGPHDSEYLFDQFLTTLDFIK